MNHKQIAKMGGSFSCLNFFLLLCLCAISSPLTLALNGGFSVELIHRDSPKSPFYIPTETPSQRAANAIRRSINRANNHLFESASSSSSVSANMPESPVQSNRGEYLMSYSIGTPPVQVLGVVDTGSDIIWLQCLPCESCYNQTTPIFDPSKSTSYHNIPCDSDTCQSTQGSSCSNSGDSCQYSISYGDGSETEGDLSLETLTLGSTSGTPVPLPKTVFGCGHNNDGTFRGQASGIVGLGNGSASLVSQMGSSINGKFSYCLVPVSSQPNVSSKLSFGDDAVVSGPGTVSTPLVSSSNQAQNVFYSVTLEAISVGKTRIDFASSPSADLEGNIIIDSGTTLTFLPPDVYSKVESAVADLVNQEKVPDPQNVLSLCYGVTSSQGVKVPVITAHFKGADVELNALNTFVQVTEDVICFSFAPAGGAGSIFGNLAQMNFLIGYDIQKESVSFKPTDCTKQ